MAKRFFRRRRKMATQWQNAPQDLSLQAGDHTVQGAGLRNLNISGGATGTLATFPVHLDLEFDDLNATARSFLTEGAVENRTLLRLVGFFRPVMVTITPSGMATTQVGAEVRYALWRGNTNEDEAAFEAVTGVSQSPDLAQPDLFTSSGLANERIGWLRSFVLPTSTVSPALGVTAARLGLDTLLQQLPWHKNAELSVVDFKSRRRITTDSKFYLLKQCRLLSTPPFPGFGAANDAGDLYSLDFARLLTRKVKA